MSGPGVGFEYPAKEVSWTKRDALLFANSIGATADELHLLYVCLPPQSSCEHESGGVLTVPKELDPKFAVFPTYPIILSTSRFLSDPFFPRVYMKSIKC